MLTWASMRSLHMNGRTDAAAAAAAPDDEWDRQTGEVEEEKYHVTCNTSNAIRHTSHVARHTSHVTRHTPHVTRHTPHATRHTSHATRHTSHVTRHTPHATRHLRPDLRSLGGGDGKLVDLMPTTRDDYNTGGGGDR